VLTNSNDVVPEGWPVLGEASSADRARERGS
jgi:hypothetical protein